MRTLIPKQISAFRHFGSSKHTDEEREKGIIGLVSFLLPSVTEILHCWCLYVVRVLLPISKYYIWEHEGRWTD